MAQSTRQQVLQQLKDNPDEVVDDIQNLLMIGCQIDCDDCAFSHLCVEEGCYIEDDTLAITRKDKPEEEGKA